MKRIYFLFIAGLMLFTSPAVGQVFQGKGDLSANAGFSLGVIGYGGWGGFGSAGFAIPITVNVDYGVHEMFSVGPYVGYLSRSYGSRTSTYSWRFTSLAFGVHGAFHASSFLNEHLDLDINEDKVDLYGKVILGYETYSYNDTGTWFDDSYRSSGRPVFGPVFGARYMFSPNFGGYAEGGRGNFGWLTLGLSFKL